eukprot:432842-Amphidinium_carterae.2
MRLSYHNSVLAPACRCIHHSFCCKTLDNVPKHHMRKGRSWQQRRCAKTSAASCMMQASQSAQQCKQNSRWCVHRSPPFGYARRCQQR